MTSRQRAFLKSIAMTTEPIFQIGKAALTPEFTEAVNEALEKRELIKISVLQNCADDPRTVPPRKRGEEPEDHSSPCTPEVNR